MGKSKAYHKMDENELVKEAHKIRGLPDLEQRVKKGHKLVTGFLRSPKVGLNYHKKVLEIDAGALDTLAQDAHSKFAEKAEEGKYLSHSEQMDLFKELANIVGPSLYKGSPAKEGTTQWNENWKQLNEYLGMIQVDPETKKTAMDMVEDYLKKGDVHAAKQFIVNTIIDQYKSRDKKNFLYELIPKDDSEEHLKLAKPVAKAYNKELEEAGIDKEVVEGDIAKAIHGAYESRAQLAINKSKKYTTKKKA